MNCCDVCKKSALFYISKSDYFDRLEKELSDSYLAAETMDDERLYGWLYKTLIILLVLNGFRIFILLEIESSKNWRSRFSTKTSYCYKIPFPSYFVAPIYPCDGQSCQSDFKYSHSQVNHVMLTDICLEEKCDEFP